MDGNIQFLLEKISHPKIMVAREVADLNTLVPQIFDCKQNLNVPSGNHGSVFKPEIKKITDNVKFPAVIRNMFQKLKEGRFLQSFMFGGVQSKMGIGDEIDGFHLGTPEKNFDILKFMDIAE
jgi:hypothetical protein